ncbi:MAG: YbaY family lipoprotein [Kiritimatiellia bacterium]
MTHRSPTSATALQIVFLSALLLAGCAHCPVCGTPWEAAGRNRDADQSALPETPHLNTIQGTITCIERVTPLPSYRLKVRLIDLESQQECAAQELGSFQGFPVFFSIVYNEKDVDNTHQYGLVCDLTSRGVPLYSTDTQYRVFNKTSSKNAEINLVLTRHVSQPENRPLKTVDQ